MIYATLEDLIDRFGEDEIADRSDHDSGQVLDASVVMKSLEDAFAEIDGYLAAKYSLPLENLTNIEVKTPSLLTRIACDIAFYRLSLVTNDDINKRYDDAVASLRRLSEGKVVLHGFLQSEKQYSGSSFVGFKVKKNAFDLKGY